MTKRLLIFTYGTAYLLFFARSLSDRLRGNLAPKAVDSPRAAPRCSRWS
jgi:hypothetical protein